MSGYLKTIVSVFLLWIFPALHAGAQTRFEEKVEEEFWLQSRNINGVRGIPVYSEPRGLSFAEFHTGFESGRFHDISDADRASRAGVRAGTLTHLHKSSFLGTISFDQRNGTGTKGSILTAPGRYPFDFLVSTPGDKTLRTLDVAGGYTLTLSPSWAVGGKMDFTYENAARRAETRLTSRRFDLSLEPSVLFRHDDFRAGLSLLFRKQNEAFTNGKNGPSVFINEGLFYGLRSDLGGIGNSFTPISSLSCGAAVQGSLMEKVCLEVAYIRSMGETGDKTISGYTFPENKVSVLAEFRWGWSITQWVRLRYEGRALSNEKTLPDWNGLIFKDREDRLTLTTQGMTHRGSGFLVRLSADRRARRASGFLQRQPPRQERFLQTAGCRSGTISVPGGLLSGRISAALFSTRTRSSFPNTILTGFSLSRTARPSCMTGTMNTVSHRETTSVLPSGTTFPSACTRKWKAC